MIRERVSTKGELRELEPPSQLAGCSQPFEKIGNVSEAGAKRFLTAQAIWDKMFAEEAGRVAQHRQDNLKKPMASLEGRKSRLSINRVRNHFRMKKNGALSGSKVSDRDKLDINSPSWDWSWALEGENPPPSSIVARRDTVCSSGTSLSLGLCC